MKTALILSLSASLLVVGAADAKSRHAPRHSSTGHQSHGQAGALDPTLGMQSLGADPLGADPLGAASGPRSHHGKRDAQGMSDGNLNFGGELGGGHAKGGSKSGHKGLGDLGGFSS